MKYHFKYSTIFQLYWAALATLWYSRQYHKPLNAPKRVGKYFIVKSVKRVDNNSTLSMGVYSKGQRKYFIKTWRGQHKDLNYYYLINEAFSCVLINKKLKDINVRVKVPKFIEMIVSDNEISVVFEFVQGKLLSTMSTRLQARHTLEIISAFEKISKKITKKEQITIFTRNINSYLVMLPVISTLVVLKSPKHFFEVLKAFIFCFKRSNKESRTKLTLSHRDLTPDNVIVSKFYLYAMDCENVAMTLKGYDLAYLTVVPEYKEVAKLIKAVPNKFLLTYILLHMSIASGDFLKVNKSLLSTLKTII